MRLKHPPPSGSLSPRPNRPPAATPLNVAAVSAAGRASPCRMIPRTNSAIFSDPRNAAAFLPRYLDGPLPALVDWDSLALLSGSFIDVGIAGSEAGLLFSAKIGGSDALFYLPWEHQRRDAPLMGLRLLSHMWFAFGKAKSGKAAPLPDLPPSTRWRSHRRRTIGKPPRTSLTYSDSRRKSGAPSAKLLLPNFTSPPSGPLAPQDSRALPSVRAWFEGEAMGRWVLRFRVFLRILGPDTRNPFFKASNISSELIDRLGTKKAFAGWQRLLDVVETGQWTAALK